MSVLQDGHRHQNADTEEDHQIALEFGGMRAMIAFPQRRRLRRLAKQRAGGDPRLQLDYRPSMKSGTRGRPRSENCLIMASAGLPRARASRTNYAITTSRFSEHLSVAMISSKTQDSGYRAKYDGQVVAMLDVALNLAPGTFFLSDARRTRILEVHQMVARLRRSSQ